MVRQLIQAFLLLFILLLFKERLRFHLPEMTIKLKEIQLECWYLQFGMIFMH
jgi:hypothetical protein